MHAVPTTTVSVYRNTTTDAFSDLVDDNTGTPTATAVPVSIVERSAVVTTPENPTPRVVTYFTGRAASSAVIRTGDRLVDETTGATYKVDSARVPSASRWAPDMRLDLRLST